MWSNQIGIDKLYLYAWKKSSAKDISVTAFITIQKIGMNLIYNICRCIQLKIAVASG